GVPTHLPPAQVSPVVHASRSSHGAVFGVCTHPVNGLQESSVHGFPSSQPRAAPPTHLPPEQVSPVVQASKSEHGAVFGVCTQPVAGLHESSVQTLPSSQGAVFDACTQPVAGLHESSVHTLLSSQLRRVPTHCPPAQVSPV